MTAFIYVPSVKCYNYTLLAIYHGTNKENPAEFFKYLSSDFGQFCHETAQIQAHNTEQVLKIVFFCKGALFRGKGGPPVLE